MAAADPPPIGAELEAVRRRHRAARLRLALRELRSQARAHDGSPGRPPRELLMAIREFERELAALGAGRPAGGASSPRSA